MNRTRHLFRLLAGIFTVILAGVFVPISAPANEIGAGTETLNGRKTTTIEKSITLESAFHVEGDLLILAGVNLNGYDITVNGNVLMDADVDLAGGSFSVTGDLHQVNGSMVPGGGFLQVGGNYYIEDTELGDDGSPKPSYGWIKMENSEDTIHVLGDFRARSYNSSVLTDGTMQFGGNVTDYKGNTLRAGGSHVAHFFYAEKDIVVDLMNGACFQSISTDGGHVRFKQLGVKTLTTDVTLYGDVEDICSKLDLNGCTLTIHGNVNNVSSEIDLNGGKLFIEGNFHQADPCIYFHNGTLETGGDYIIDSLDKEEDGTPKPSYGWLKMEDEDDHLLVGGNFSARSYNSSVLTRGIMEFQRDVTDIKGNTIRGSEYHKAVFSGSSHQVVDLQNSSACFQSISTVNQDVAFLQMGIHELTEDIVLTGDTADIWNKLDLNGFSLTIRGNVARDSSDLTLNGGHMTITGNFLQADAAIYFTGGILEVGGDYRIESTDLEEDGITLKPSYGWLKMEYPEDTLIVGNDFSARSYNSSVLTAGIMEFRGNVTDYKGNTVRASGDHKAVFSGAGRQQLVDLQSSSACFETISTLNDHVTFLQLGVCRLTENITLDGDIEDIWNKLDLNGFSMKVLGSVKKVSSDIDLNGGSFIVGKDFCLADPALYFNGGALFVTGDFTVENPEKEEDGTPKPSYGWLKMENDTDRLVVEGSFSARSYNSSVLSAGSMEFAGDVYDYKGNTIRGSGTHTATFFGEGPQVVEFASSSACFQSIKTPNTQVRFRTLGVSQLTEDVTITGPIEKIWNKLDLNGQKMTILGDVEGLMSDLDLNGGILHVTGNFRHLDPAIYFNGGSLEIEGNYLLQSPETDSDGSWKSVYGWLKMENPEDHMVVYGDFTAQSYNSSVMTAGALEIGGEMTDLKGNTLRMTGNPGETTLTSGEKVRRRRESETQVPVMEPETSPKETTVPETTPVPETSAQPETTAAATTAEPETSPVKTAQFRVMETDKVFYLYKTEDGLWAHAVKVPVNDWVIIDKNEVDKAFITRLVDGGCRLDVSYTPGSNPFSEGPRVTVSCTYEGQKYYGSWEEGVRITVEDETRSSSLTSSQQAVIDQVTGAVPTTLPPGIIKMNSIQFKGYNDAGLPITGYEFAVREGDQGDWKTVKSQTDEVRMSLLFPKLELGTTYWYRYRYYVTVDGTDYYSEWSSEMGDVYTVYD